MLCGLLAGAYIARQAAKSVVASGLAKRCLVQISYAIGVAQPLSVHVDTYGTGSKPDKVILAAVLKAFDFRPGKLLIRRCCCLCRQTCIFHSCSSEASRPGIVSCDTL